MGGGGSGGGGGPSYAPPDLPSQVLDARILYIGMPVRSPAPFRSVRAHLDMHIRPYLSTKIATRMKAQSISRNW